MSTVMNRTAMARADPPSADWRDVAAALPGVVAVQSDDAFTHVSEDAADVLGVAAAALEGDSWRSLFDPAEADRLAAAVERARRDGGWEGTARTGGRADELPVAVRVAATDDGLVWSIRPRDATGRDGTGADRDGRSDAPATGTGDEESGDAGSRPSGRGVPARAVLDAIGDVVYVVDDDGSFRLWNRALEERTGYGPDEIAEMCPRDLLPPDERDPAFDLAARDDGVRTAQRVGLDLLTADGDRRTHEFTGTTFRNPASGRPLRCVVARDVSDRIEREAALRRQRTLVQGILNAIPDVVFAYDEDGNHIVEDALLDEFAGYPRAELAEMELLDFLPEEDRPTAREHFRRTIRDGETVTYETEIVTKDGRPIPHEFRAAPMELDGERLGIAAAARDITDRRRRERKLARQRDGLATLDRINELLLETTRELIETSSRAAVERIVCERLAASDLYRFAWVGERELDGDRILPRESAGGGDGYLDAVTITADESAADAGPTARAMRTGEVQVAAVDDPCFEPYREQARERGIESVAAVPLRHGEAVYGVLAVCAGREDAFSDRERAGFDVLGRTVGFVIYAARNRQLLFADAVVELEFDLGRERSVIANAAAALGCQLRLDGYVSSGDRWILYLSVDGATPAAVVETASADPLIERGRVISEAGHDGRIELILAESSLLHTVTAAGATVRTITADGSGARLVVEAPMEVDVRDVVEQVRAEYPGAELVARHEHDREVTTVGRPGGLLDALTDRQREAVEAAYRAGYFAWPRESTAEAVAGSLGVTAPTLHAHLRKAERTILSALLDGDGDGDGGD